MVGYSPDRIASENHHRIATFYGQSSDDWREVNAGQDIDAFHITGGIRAFGPGRVNYHFGWEGPSASIDAACSGSALSIQLACSALRSRECGMALAGGGNLMTASDLFAGLSRGNFLSPTGSCKTWNENADGYCRADAVGTVVLKRLEDAVQNNDNILGVIDAAATNHSANAVSITHPDTGTQQRLFREVLQIAGVKSNEVDFVEMHGTGTQAGDYAESRSVTEVSGNARGNRRPLLVGTVKPNLGHGGAAPGVTSVMKALMMMMRNSIILRHIGVKTRVNNKLSLASSTSVVIPLENVPFVPGPGSDGRRRVLVNNFNATGGNTSIVLEDFPERKKAAGDPRKFHVVSVSAATPSSFKANIRKLADYLIATPKVDLADLSYTTTARRMHHGYRFARSVSRTSRRD